MSNDAISITQGATRLEDVVKTIAQTCVENESYFCDLDAVAGDGDFLMHGQEFATAVQYGLNIIVVLLDNAMYGTIRMHQEREYPGRVSGTALKNPDFRAYAQAFGGHGERVERTEDFAPALARARASGLPAILHCLLDPEAITPAGTLQGLRDAALARR